MVSSYCNIINLDNKKIEQKDYNKFKSQIVNLKHNKNSLAHVPCPSWRIQFIDEAENYWTERKEQ